MPCFARLSFLFLAALSVALAEPVFELVELNLPSDVPSYAVDLNEKGSLVGFLAESTNTAAFLWKDGTFTRIPTPPIASWPEAINNKDEIVGGYNPPPDFSSGSAYWITRTWRYSNGTLELLTEDQRQSSATGINDEGQIVGTINSYGIILSEPKFPMTDDWGGVGPTNVRFEAINNLGRIVGLFNGAGYRWTAYDKRFHQYLDQSRSVFAINSRDQTAGGGGLRLGSRIAAIWNGTNVTFLGSPIALNTDAKDISENGIIVGTAEWPERNSRALIWTNNVGIDLTSITRLPVGATLVDAVAVNTNGFIAANMVLEDTNHAVLLRPAGTAVQTANIKFAAGSTGVFSNQPIRIAIETASWPVSVTNVTYRLHRRALNPGVCCGDFYTPPTWHQALDFSTNLTEAPFAFEPRNLQPGHYAIDAELQDANGVRAHLLPSFFTIIENVRLDVLRMNLAGEFEFGFNGTPGVKYIIESSIDLADWRKVEAIEPSSGGNLRDNTPNRFRTFYRARAVEVDEDIYPAQMEWPTPPPQSLNNKTLYLLHYSNQQAYTFSFAEGKVQVIRGESNLLETGSYTYERSVTGVNLVVNIPGVKPRKIVVAIDWPVPVAFGNSNWRATEFYDGTKTESSGRFRY